ncbi:MAG: hypothetical protein FWD71_02825 [Oscillospiraceae bacterium]|nr:hypothetical protein [Oscillospiraceae bacterium]
MLKYNLREDGFSVTDKQQGQTLVTFIWVILTAAILAVTFTFVIRIVGVNTSGGTDPLAALADQIGLMAYIIALVGSLVIYLILKFIMTLLFCYSSPASSIKLKILEGTAMPVCFCREAFKIWQTVLMYCVPVAVMYTTMFIFCVISGANAAYIIIIFFMSFYMAYDLTLVLYVLFYKIKDGIDYVSIDHHVYYMTFFTKSYIRVNKKAKRLLNK